MSRIWYPYVYPNGTATRPSVEALWDYALGQGVEFMGVAVDDTHHMRVDGDPPAYPGRAWVEVFSKQDDPRAICDAMREGLLYASTGVSIRRIAVTKDTYSVWPDVKGTVVSFIGRGGLGLERATAWEGGRPASYVIHGGEGYVRVKLLGEDGKLAWTPAVPVSADHENQVRSARR